jgi:putative ABC transport system substrate-binding protein
MRRRSFIAMMLTAASRPLAGRAQQSERIRRVGYLTGATGSPEDELGVVETRALVEGLRELGWFDGRNIVIEHRFSGSGRARIQANSKALVALNPDVIITVGGPSLAALLAETRTIPIVFTVVSDPVAAGFVTNLSHPVGNATGFSVSEALVAGKWLQLLKEIAPSINRALVIAEADSPANQVLQDGVVAAGPPIRLEVATAAVQSLGDVEKAVEAFAREPGGGLVVLSNPLLADNIQGYHALAMQYRLPAIYSYPVYARSGGLISYGIDPVEQFHGAAGYIDKILRGAKPSDLPVQQPTRFYLVINMKTAKALGLTVPPSILARADEVIE